MIGSLANFIKGKGLANALRRMNLDIRPLTDRRSRYSGLVVRWESDTDEICRGAVVEFSVGDKVVRFFVQNELDEIQSAHRKGSFYEQEELAIIAKYFKKGGVFVDVGANVGNHAVYALAFLNASKVIAVEPLREASRILELNLLLNGLIDRTILHQNALAEQPGHAEREYDPKKIDNLGATRLHIGDGPVRVVTGDSLLERQPVDFIKIDTEGFELNVLQGLLRTIARDRPCLFVEVENENQRAFEGKMEELEYTTVEQFRRYPTSLNNLVIPNETIKSISGPAKPPR